MRVLSAIALIFATILGGNLQAWDLDGERHLSHFNAANPRPDFFAKPLYNNRTSYREAYNRPTYVGGHVAAVIEPTSQEAMAWHINKANGNYRNHSPGCVPIYAYPKPWEVLAIEPRPNAPLTYGE